MKRESGNPSGRRMNQEQKTFLQMMALPAVVIILIVIIRIAERPKEAPEESVELPTVAVLETGMTVAGELPDWEEERLPEEPGVEPETMESEESESETEAEGLDEFATEDFQRDSVPELLTLMEKYFEARELADAAAMNQLYGISGLTDQELEAQSARMRNNSKYVQNFENIVTYVKKGPEADSWLVYAVADINFYSAKTRAPMILWCYVTKDDEGNYVIKNNQDFSSAEQQFINEANHSDEVRRLAADVNHRLREALSSDENLNRVYGVLREGSPIWEGTGESEPEVVIGGTEPKAASEEEATEPEAASEEEATEPRAQESEGQEPEEQGTEAQELEVQVP